MGTPEPSITVVTATINRPSLRDAHASIAPQLGKDDVHLIVTDGIPVTSLPSLPRAVTIEGPRTQRWGHAQRQHAIDGSPLTSHLVFMDDDDLMVWGAIDALKEVIRQHPDLMILSRFQPHKAGVTWDEQVIRIGNVGTPSPCVPWDRSRLGSWMSERYEADYDFIVGCGQKLKNMVWFNRVVQVARKV